MIIGGIAAVLHGVPRATFDLDILIEASRENAEALLDALREAGLGTANLIDSEELLDNEITVFKDRMRIDVLTAAPGIRFAEAWARREVMQYRKQELNVASRHDVIASKKAAGRAKDLEDARILSLGDDRPT
ncbi:MAG TPA: hypothetical protein VLV83_05190 [Acidobacteriota bacterium]|nr:hypothetical protein [Acidobacteriota bacterium]